MHVLLAIRATLLSLRTLFAATILAPALLCQTHSGLPVDITAGPAPQAVRSGGHAYVLYELHLVNFVSLPINLVDIDVRDQSGASVAKFSRTDLENMVVPVERLSSAASPSGIKGNLSIGEGHAVIIFFDLAVDGAAPKQLLHRFSFSVPRKGKTDFETTLTGPVVSVIESPTLGIRPPLSGPAWVAFNALGARDHRRSLNAFDGREYIPQRFAIDWMKLGPDGRLSHGTPDLNWNFYSYDAEVLAVAAARVSEIRDGNPDNNGTTDREKRQITLDNVLGNYVVLDLGRSRYALYAHLRPGSLRVKVGDQVAAGAVLGHLGNSGNSDQPHLHFQIVDANSPLGAEGVPFELDAFTQLGIVREDADAVPNAVLLAPSSKETPVIHHNEFPTDRAVGTFPTNRLVP